MQNVASPAVSAPTNIFARWWNDASIRIPILVFVAARILTLVIAAAALRIGPVHNAFANDPIFVASLRARQLDSPLNFLIEPWHRWDTGWYLKLAVQGYNSDDGSVIFAPLYPGLMDIVDNVVGDTLLAGLIISSVACLFFLIVLYKLVMLDVGRDAVARNTLFALITFPTAFYLMAAYTESTFMVFVAGALLTSRYRRWVLAGLLSACAALTRAQGWVLFFPIGWLAFVEGPRFWQAQGISWKQKIWQSIPRLFAVGMGPFMVLVFFGILAFSGLGNIADAYSKYWALIVRPPWSPVIDVIGKMVAGTASFTEISGFVALVFIVVLMLASIRTLPIVYHLYMWPTLVLILLRYYTPTLLNGTMRYVLDFFPIFITVAIAFVRYPRLRPPWIVIGVTIQIIMLYLFVCWQWIA